MKATDLVKNFLNILDTTLLFGLVLHFEDAKTNIARGACSLGMQYMKGNGLCFSRVSNPRLSQN